MIDSDVKDSIPSHEKSADEATVIGAQNAESPDESYGQDKIIAKSDGDEQRELTVMAVEFSDYKRFFSIYKQAGSLKLKAYQDIIISRAAEHGGKILKLRNDVVTVYYTDTYEALKSAIRMKTSLFRHISAVPKQEQIGFALFIHYGPGIIAGNEIKGDVSKIVARMANMMGKRDLIYVSEYVIASLGEKRGIEYDAAGTVSDFSGKNINIHQVRWSDDVNVDVGESIMETHFQHRYSLIEGAENPCFYCGSKKHHPVGCPSKHLPESADSINKLKYLSVRNLNTLFRDAFSRGLDTVRYRWEQNADVTDSFFDAYYGFYDIKRVFQLRFGRVCMNYKGDDWNHAVKSKRGIGSGSMWVALDYLRTGDVSRAETLLQALHEENPHSFETNLAMGYLNIEKGHHIHALDSFKDANKYAHTRPRQILSLLLAFRTNCLYFNDLESAREQIRLIRNIDRNCPEAEYQEIVLRMGDEKDSSVIKQLTGHIRKYPEHYVTALIDPDLIKAQASINESLAAMYEKIRKEATSLLSRAEDRMKGMESWFREDDRKVEVLREKFIKAKQICVTDSYIGYLDGIANLESVLEGCDKTERESRTVVRKHIDDLRNQINRFSLYFTEVKQTAPVGMIDSIRGEIVDLERDLESALSYKDAMARHKLISERLITLHDHIELIEKKRAIASFLSGIAKKAVLSFFMIASLVLILFFVNQHTSFVDVDLLSNLLESRGYMLFGASILSLVIGAALEYRSSCRQKNVPQRKTATKVHKKK